MAILIEMDFDLRKFDLFMPYDLKRIKSILKLQTNQILLKLQTYSQACLTLSRFGKLEKLRFGNI